MPAALSLLRRLAEQHEYAALHDACQGMDREVPGLQVLRALAEVHLGNGASGRRRLESLDCAALDIAARVDVAAVYIGLGEIDQAIRTLEAAMEQSAAADGSDQALLLARLAWCRLQQGHNEDALTLYERSLALEPFLAVYFNVLRLHRDSGRLSDMTRCLDAAERFWTREQENWPAGKRRVHARQLRGLRLDLWLAQGDTSAVEAWVGARREILDEDDWCALVVALAERLAANDRHPQAEEWLREAIRHHPEHAALYAKLAELALLQGRPLQTVALLRRAIHAAGLHDKPTDAFWTRLSGAALSFDPALAREAAERAVEQLGAVEEPIPHALAERRFQAELALADVEAAEQHYEAAERRYRQALEQHPTGVSALHGLGQLLVQLGRIDEAAALFERATAIDPTRGYGALISVRRIPEDDATLQRLEALARTPGPEGSVRGGLLLRLATAWENRGDYDKAFALADDGNAADRRLLHYDPATHRQHCARIRHAFPKALYAHRADVGNTSTVPVFVVGMPRSGTTLVEQIIAGHSRIHGAGELGTIPRVIAGLERWERHTGSGRRYPDCVDDLDAKVARGIAGGVLRELGDYAPDADHVVDKLPHNFENIGLIKLLFPRAKIISVRRDPRDIAISNYFVDYAGKHGGMGFAYDLDWIGEQLADHNLLMHHWQQVFPGEILEIRYEDVVDQPEASARRLLDYLGVDWEPQVLQFEELERPVRTASVWQVRQPLYATSKARWQRYRQHLKPLLEATNRRIAWDPIEMVTLPEPGWLNDGVDHYRSGDLDAAEYRFKQLLHHLPEHAAARFMLGVVYVRKGHHGDAIALMEQALERCPWNRQWRSDLARAYRLDGRDEDAAAAEAHRHSGDAAASPAAEPRAAGQPVDRLDYLFLSGESTCSNFGSTKSGAHC